MLACGRCYANAYGQVRDNRRFGVGQPKGRYSLSNRLGDLHGVGSGGNGKNDGELLAADAGDNVDLAARNFE
jgi:hypothetical protein